MIVDSDETVISNMPVEEEEMIENKKKKVVFQQTPCMSTYLICFVIGDFDFVEKIVQLKNVNSTITLRAYTPVGEKEKVYII